MPKVKMKTLSAGPDGVMDIGKVYDVTAKEAKALIEGRYAEAVDEPKEAAEQEQPKDEEKPKSRK